jgi:hypothetical protein
MSQNMQNGKGAISDYFSANSRYFVSRWAVAPDGGW